MTLQKQLRILAKPYYWINILMALSYVAAKKIIPICKRIFPYNGGGGGNSNGNGDALCELDSRETEILFFLLIVIMIRSRKTGSVTMINYLSSSFLYTKVANAILWAYSDFRYGLIFSVLCILVGMLLPEPTYTGPEYITYFRTGPSFEDELLRDKRLTWLICFYTVWSPTCVNFAPIFAELSAEYSLDNLKFGKIDISRFPKIAEKYYVMDSSLSRQLPTVILFQNGKEVERRPLIDTKGKVHKFFFSADNVRAAFGLNNLYKQCVKHPLKQKSLQTTTTIATTTTTATISKKIQ